MIRQIQKGITVCALLLSFFLAGCGGKPLTSGGRPLTSDDWARSIVATVLTANLSHAWLPPTCQDHSCTLMSGIAPVLKPPAMVAVMNYEPYKGAASNTLSQIMDEQAENIRIAANPSSYTDNDGHAVKQNVAMWTERVDGHDVGYIKHFMLQAGVQIMLRHAIVFDAAGHAYFVHLMSLDDAHRAEVLADQQTLVARIAAQGAGAVKP
ncbi:MAG: hypothetical protein PW788_11260 [Micavibrio sp.]|nr:hypothetical protein [Micavibrio sp.]